MMKKLSMIMLALVVSASLVACSSNSKTNNSGEEASSALTEWATKSESVTEPITVYVAKKIITMEPSIPVATAVAVAGGKIVAVGSLDSLQSWTKGKDVTVDYTLQDKIVTPGFIDPHVHPSLPATLTLFPFIAPDDWTLPTGFFPGATTPEAYKARLKELVAEYEKTNSDVPFVTWGYHQLWHGDIVRADLDEMFPNTPVMLWHRSFHEIVGNTAAFDMLNITEADFSSHEANWEEGHAYEFGFKSIIAKMTFLAREDRFREGLGNFFEMVHLAGVTTVLDMGVGVIGDPNHEIEVIRSVAEGNEVPSRIILTPLVTDFIVRNRTPEQALAEIEMWRSENSRRVQFDNHFKLMLDGAIYSGLSQFNYPGYIDGHEGVWMSPLDITYSWGEFFWNQDYQIHAHTNGDKSADALTEMVREMQKQKPRSDHRTVLEHFAYATETQAREMKELGIVVSANPYYQYILSDIYAEYWLGEDRARKMVALGSLDRYGITYALHSDAPMAPLSPLTLMGAAVNRITINGNKNLVSEKISVDRALRAVTIDAAWIMGRESSIGSILAGKMADLTILEEDPYTVDTQKIKDIEIWGTMFEGELYPIDHKGLSDADKQAMITAQNTKIVQPKATGAPKASH